MMLIIPVAYIIIFKYVPMYGVTIAFKNFNMGKGILGSEWNNFKHFKVLFSSYTFYRVLRNTVIISLQRIVFEFPAAILFALILNELRSIKFKKVVQTVSYLPYFMSWVVLAGIINEILSPQRGIINIIIIKLGGEPIYFLTEKRLFRSILVVTNIWRSVGWGAIIYLAALSAINPSLYEAAEIDGANRFQKMMHISIPSILPVVVIMFIIKLSYILKAGFDQIFNLYNPLVYEVADIFDTYVYRVGLVDVRFDYSTAVGFFMNVVGLVFVVGSNMIIRKYSEYGIW
jgi:putative aldouronate transport system permease protein